MGKAGRKPLNHHMCEEVYKSIAMNLSKHKSPRDAIIHFIENSETFKSLRDGKLYDDYLNDCLKHPVNDDSLGGKGYVEPETGEFHTEEDLEELRKDRDRIKLEIARVADPSERSDKTSTGLSDRAYKQIWRMCESYEKYCIETNQPGPLPLGIVKNLPPHIIK